MAFFSKEQRKKNPARSHAVADNLPEGVPIYPARPIQMQKTTGVLQREELADTPRTTGLPDSLKSGIEAISGVSMNDVKVHYNSDKPAQLDAHAYAQGTDIFVGPGQERHLPHEAWHVVQQKGGRVDPTVQLKEGVAVNDDPALEEEADVMGAKATQRKAVNNRARG